MGLVQFTSALFILLVHFKFSRSLENHRRNLEATTSKVESIVLFYMQMIVLTSSSILCWIPSGTIFLVSLYLDKYPMVMIIWTIAFVVPITSIINPIVFIITTLKKV